MTQAPQTLSDKQMAALLAMLVAIMPFSVDAYLPAIPAMAEAFQGQLVNRPTVEVGQLAADQASLPQPLRVWLGLRASRLNRALSRQLAGHTARVLQSLPAPLHQVAAARAFSASSSPGIGTKVPDDCSPAMISAARSGSIAVSR